MQRVLLTLAFVEPQHTASEHRHGRGHGGGERAGGPMDFGLMTLKTEEEVNGGRGVCGIWRWKQMRNERQRWKEKTRRG